MIEGATVDPSFWAKKSDKDGVMTWLPLAQHLEDTMRVSIALWDHWLADGIKERIASEMGVEEEEARRVAGFLGSIHDIGKAVPAFQSKSGFHCSEDLDAQLLEKLERAGFSGITTLDLDTTQYSHHSIVGQYLLEKYGIRRDIAVIVSGHHGKSPDDTDDLDLQRSYLENIYQKTNVDDAVYRLWEGRQHDILLWALSANEYDGAEELPAIPLAYQVIYQGLLIMADWIASNEHYFPLIPIDADKVNDSEARFEKGWKAWMQTRPPQAQAVDVAEIAYQSRFGSESLQFVPKDAQKVFFDVVENVDDPGIFIFEAPMGLGKTEAALIAAEQLAYKTKRNGLFFGLPTQATSNGMFPRIENWLRRIAEEQQETVSLRLVHGKAALNKSYADLPNASQIDQDGDAFSSVAVNGWFSGRKTTALDDFVVGTIDQFLLTALKQKHLALRHLGFSRKVVIIDEIHAADCYMSTFLLQAIRWMGVYGVPVILLSATLPAQKREEMVQAYLEGRGLDKTEIELPREGMAKDAYPLITYSDGSRIEQHTVFEPIPEKTVKVERYFGSEIELMEDLYSDGGVIGVIVNTVKKAQQLGALCRERFGEDSVEILHSSFTARDRIRREEQLLGMIGKEADRPKRKIVIGTQVIEQSLDIDFDVMISELAPMDFLLQRVGRLHRHRKTKRPDRHKEPVLYVLGADPGFVFDAGSVAVYGEYLLARTEHFLPDVLHVPGDISKLVQMVYGDIEVNYKGAIGEAYKKSKKKHEELVSTKESNAYSFRVGEPDLSFEDWEGEPASLMGWLKYSANSYSEARDYQQVRDIEDSVEVIALKRHGSGYGFFEKGGDISIDLKNGNMKVAKEIATRTLQLPVSVCGCGRLDATILELEKITKDVVPEWRNIAWLSGALVLLFDEDNRCTLGDWQLQYDTTFGLVYESKERM